MRARFANDINGALRAREWWIMAGRPGAALPKTTLCTIGKLTIDFETLDVLTPTLHRPLTHSEWQVIDYLMQHAGCVVDRATLAALLDLECEHVDATIRALRSALGAAVAIRGIGEQGYRLN
jgi:DNA-binding response OmpR family regulator